MPLRILNVISRFLPPSPPFSPPPYYQILEHGYARLGRVKNNTLVYNSRTLKRNCPGMNHHIQSYSTFSLINWDYQGLVWVLIMYISFCFSSWDTFHDKWFLDSQWYKYIQLRSFLYIHTVSWEEFESNWKYFQLVLHRVKEHASGVQNIVCLKF